MAIKKLKSDFISLKAGEVIDSITGLASGKTVVTSHTVAASGAVTYFERLYGTGFVLQGTPVKIETQTKSAAAHMSQVVEGLDGTYWVLMSAPPSAGQANVRGQQFGTDGSKIGTVTSLDTLEGTNGKFPATLTGTGDAAAPVALLDFQGGATPSLILQTFDAGMNVLNSVPVLTPDNAARMIDVSNTFDHKILGSWVEDTANGLALRVAAFGLDGTAIVNALTVRTGEILDAEVDSFTNGNFVVTYREKVTSASAPNGVRLVSKIYDAAGTLLGTADKITIFEKVYSKDFETVAMPDGRFAVIWVTDDHANPAKTDLFLQYFRQDGKTISNEILIGNVGKTGINLHAALNDAGKLVVNWTGISGTVKTEHSAVFDPLKFVATSGYDQWYGGDAAETINGLGGNDALYGANGDDKINGGLGRDFVGGGEGADQLNGGSGFDYADYYFDTGVRASLANPSINTGAAFGDTYLSIEGLYGSDEGSDTLTGDAGDNVLYGNGGNDRLFGGKGNDSLIGGKGTDELNGGAGTDLASYHLDTAVTASLLDSLVNRGAAKGDTYTSIENLEGSSGADRLTGSEQDNEIFGLAGNDVIDGYLGNDRLEGGDGADKLYGSDGDDELWGGKGADALVGGEGFDFADYFSQGAVTLSLAKKFATAGAAKGDTFSGIEGVFGSDQGGDKIGGNGQGNTIWGYGGNDKIYGEGGDDTLLGGRGADVLDGGAGRDMADYYADGAVTISLDGSFSATGAAKGDKLISIEELGGSRLYGDTLVGDGKDNYLAGNGGADHLIGRGGVDGIKGGTGRDILEGGEGLDYFVYSQVADGGDRIVDFEEKEYLSFYSGSFGFSGAGFLPADSFAIGKYFGGFALGISSAAFFFFQTTDDTLWVYHDGKKTMMADLDISFNLTANNIYIYE